MELANGFYVIIGVFWAAFFLGFFMTFDFDFPLVNIFSMLREFTGVCSGISSISGISSGWSFYPSKETSKTGEGSADLSLDKWFKRKWDIITNT